MEEDDLFCSDTETDDTSNENQTHTSEPCSRRAFLTGIGSVAALAMAANTLGITFPSKADSSSAGDVEPTYLNPYERRNNAFQIRLDAALYQKNLPLPSHPNNREERDYPYLGNFSKGLPHDELGEVDPRAYRTLLKALWVGKDSAFEQIPLGGTRPLTNPQAGIAYDIEGPDSHHLAIRPAPRIDSAENSSEAMELYWMALARDVNFTDYQNSSLIEHALQELSDASDFRGPTDEFGFVSPGTIFRGNTPGDLDGPYISQFLLNPIPYGTLHINQRQWTAVPELDYMTDLDSWLAIQNGNPPLESDPFDDKPRYIRNGRDLATYVHYDALYEAYLNACFILLGMGAPFDEGNPYDSLAKTFGFGTFGGPHILSLVTEVATRALKAVWFQKWYVHRRLRPEEFGGRVHSHLKGKARYPLDDEILGSQSVQKTYDEYHSYLLPQAFPEGSPTHPAYGSGHATVAGACVTILKAWFDESFIFPNPVVPNERGTKLIPYHGRDSESLSIGGELNKLAANVAFGRNFAGIHWRTDYSESLKLGEAVAIGILRDQKRCYQESFTGFSLTRFDGRTITI